MRGAIEAAEGIVGHGGGFEVLLCLLVRIHLHGWDGGGVLEMGSVCRLVCRGIQLGGCGKSNGREWSNARVDKVEMAEHDYLAVVSSAKA